MAFRKEDYWIKARKDLIKYKLRLYRRELKAEKEAYEKLLAGTERRKASYKPKFESWDEMMEAYASGVQTDVDFRRERGAVWNVYSDRGHIARIAWLEEELAKVEKESDLLQSYVAELRQDTKRRHSIKQRRHRKRPSFDKSFTQERLDQKYKELRRERNMRYAARKKQLAKRAEKYKEFFA